MFQQRQSTRLIRYIFNNRLDQAGLELHADHPRGFLNGLDQSFTWHRTDEELLGLKGRGELLISSALLIEISPHYHYDNASTTWKRPGVVKVREKLRTIGFITAKRKNLFELIDDQKNSLGTASSLRR